MRFARHVGNKPEEAADTTFVRISSVASGLLIFSYGLFTIAAQSLLFREFITTFEGNDISVGIFFASWFLWVGVGALLVYRAKTFAEKLLKNIEFLFLAYLPAFVLELVLIIQARELAGVESYALLSVRTVLLLSIVVNAPVSIITGMLFPTACRWIRAGNRLNPLKADSPITNHQLPITNHQLPVSRVYITEAAGSFVGGLGVTVLLGFGASMAKVFLILAFIVSLSAFCVQLAKVRRRQLNGSSFYRFAVRPLVFLLPVCILLCLAFGVDKALMRYVRITKWAKLLDADALVGSFRTAQAEYLYGVYQGQWVAIREGSVCETLPDESTAGRIAAIGLCQNPDAVKVLVIGSGLGLCREFLRLPQTEEVTWTHCDSEYVRKVDKFIPPELKISDERFYRPAGDIRSLLSREKQRYDIVILNLPDATSSVLNRYYTLEFYRQIKESLRSGGVLQVRVAGGENIMGTELINLGASMKLTLQKVFSQLVLTPGEDTWFIVSDSESLTGDPGILQDRFAAIKGGSDVFPPHALLSVYLPDRAAAALENYASADLPENLLINRDSRPLTHLYSLLLTAKQSGAPIAKLVKHLALAGPLAFLIPVFVFVALRIIYVSSGAARSTLHASRNTSFDSTFLVFSAGCVGIGVVIVLMYLYQTRFGSLYLYIGVISSVFMAGLTIGAALISHLMKRIPYLWQSYFTSRFTLHASLLFAVIFAHILILAAIAFWPIEQWTHLIFVIVFVLCGLCAGCYFPLAARQLADARFETGQAGSKLETADHLGASVGGLLTSLALVPVLGTRVTLFVFVLLILANVPFVVLRIYKGADFGLQISNFRFQTRRLGYILFGISVSIVLCSNLLADAGAKLTPSLPQYAAQALAGQSRLEQTSALLGNSARRINYFKVYEPIDVPADEAIAASLLQSKTAGRAAKEKLSGYVFSSEDLARDVRGFGGRMNLAIYADTAGKLINFHIIRSNETPVYLELLSQWRGALSGRRLFGPQPFTGVQAVTGATVSSKAVLSALETSGHKFASQILGQTIQPGIEERAPRASYLPDTRGVYLISALVLTLLVIYRGGFWSRLAILCFNLVVGGIVLNAQYSSEQIATILSLNAPAAGLSGAFLLAVGMPLLVVFFGNIYCGYICPFGAAQELIGYVLGSRFRPSLPAEKMRKTGFVKYIILFVLIVVFFLSRNRTTLAADPLISVFNLRFTIYDFQPLIKSGAMLVIAAALIGSIFYVRFWCRYLCPVGAFLSLLNGVVILKRYLPAKKFVRCEFGLTDKDQMDCLYCDRCRYRTKEHKGIRAKACPERSQRGQKGTRVFMTCVFAVATLVSVVSVSRFLQVASTGFDQSAALVSSGGQSRDVDLQRIQKMIRQKRLSDREAEFYKKVK